MNRQNREEKAEVIVLRQRAAIELDQAVRDAGCSPIIVHTIAQALRALQRHVARAIVYDDADQQSDALEFVLNVRDVDRRTPIIIRAHHLTETQQQALRQQPGTGITYEDKALVQSLQTYNGGRGVPS